MKELIKAVEAIITGVHSRSYLEEAPQKDPDTNLPPVKPYVVFKFPTSTPNFTREDFILSVDIWGDDPDTTEIEQITTKIDTALDRQMVFIQGKLSTRFYRINRNMLPDPDQRLRRRELRFECKTYLKTYF